MGRNRFRNTFRQVIRLRVGGRGSARAEDAQVTPTQSHISPSILQYTRKIVVELMTSDRQLKASREGLESEHNPVRISGSGFGLEGLGFGIWLLKLWVRSRGVVMWGSGLRV